MRWERMDDMTDEEFDLMMARKLGAYARAKRLPENFAARLVGAVGRRRRRARRLRLAVVAGCLALTVVTALGVSGRSAGVVASAPALVAAPPDGGRGEKVSGFLLLGFIRDFFRRPRAVRKKEDE